MGRAPCCDKVGLKRGPWTPEEDQVLISFILQHGHSNWRALPKQAGLLRCGKSCRLRWINYLKPDIKRGNFTKEEEDTIIQLHQMMGNRWSAIAARLPGRTDNEIKNVWHTHLKKMLNKQNDQTKNSSQAKTTTKKHHNTSTITNSSSSSDNQVPNSSISNSSDGNSSLTEVSSEQTREFDTNEFELDEFPIIDETFWSAQEFSYDDIINMDDTKDFTSMSYNMENGHVNEMANEDFWLDVFVTAGGSLELPDF